MKEFKGTKGEWSFEKGKYNTSAQEHTHSSGSVKGEYFVCSIFNDLATTEESEANAKLIAAAPELLEALQIIIKNVKPESIDLVRRRIGSKTMLNDESICKALEAIEKALN